MQPRDGLVPKKSADSLDRLEVLPVPDGPDAATMHEGLVDSEVEPVAGGLHAGAVQRARSAADGDATATRAPERLVVDSVLEEQQLDARI
jgi:hypothetical protein